MGCFLRYDYRDKVYRISRAAIYVLWLLLLLLWVIPPVPAFDKMLVVALEDLSRVFLGADLTLEGIKKAMGDEEPQVRSRQRGREPFVQHGALYSFFRNNKEKLSLSYSFWGGKFDSVVTGKHQFRRRGVPYALIRENCLNAVRDRFGTTLDNTSRHERTDIYLLPLLGSDGLQHIVTIRFDDYRFLGRAGIWENLSVLIAPKEEVRLSLSYRREPQ